MSRKALPTKGAEIDLMRACLVCVDTASEALELATENPNRAAHRVRREMKRLRALVQFAPKPRPDWLVQLGAGAAASHQELAELRDGCVVAATLEKVRTLHPRRWQPVLPLRSEAKALSNGQIVTLCAVVRGHLDEMKTLIGATPRPFGADAELGAALARSYRKARRARAVVPAAIDQEAVHAWRKAMYRLCFQLQLAAPLLSRPARAIEAELVPLTRTLGRCGDLALARKRLETRKLFGVKARTRIQLLDWIERRRQKIAHEILASTAKHFERRPRDFAKWCLR